MMSYESKFQPKLFYYHLNREKRIPQNHILRKIKEKINFDFVYAEVKDTYGINGNVSVPPPVILKLMLLLILYNVRSERELMDTISLRLDWLWFLGYDLDSEIPNHSVLSKARARWGVKAFKAFFERIVSQCVQEGLVEGRKLFIDTSLIEANASNNSVVDTQSLGRYLKKGYRELEERLEGLTEGKKGKANERYLSTTDPDASVVRHGRGKSKLRYKTHRVVDNKKEVVTATKVTTGSVDDGDMLKEMIEQAEGNTGQKVEVVVGDSRYGTKENFLMCGERKIKAHLANLEETNRGRGRQEGIFPKEAFRYDREKDIFICPAGEVLRRRHFYQGRQNYEYKAGKGVCRRCKLRMECTRAKDGRTLKRHIRQEELERLVELAGSAEARRDRKIRQHLSERSFAQSIRYGYKRARWRRLWRVQIQDYLIAVVQNIQVLLKEGGRRAANAARELRKERLFLYPKGLSTIWQTCWDIFWDSEIRIDRSFAII